MYAGLCRSERRAWRDPYTLILTPFTLPTRPAPPAPACGTRSLTLWQPSGMLVLLPAPWHATLEVAPCPGADVACGGPAHAPRHAVPVQASEITRDTTAVHTARVHTVSPPLVTLLEWRPGAAGPAYGILYFPSNFKATFLCSLHLLALDLASSWDDNLYPIAAARRHSPIAYPYLTPAHAAKRTPAPVTREVWSRETSVRRS